MELNSVQASGEGVDGGLAELLNDARDLVGFERAGRFEGDHADAVDPGFDVGGNRRRGNGLSAAGEQLGMGDAAAVHNLQEDVAAGSMDLVSDEFPADDLFGRVDAGDPDVAFAHGG